MSDQRLSTAIAVLPVLSAGLYLMGATYHGGYIATFGLDESLFLPSIDRLLLWGFLALVNVTLLPLGYTILSAAGLVIAVMVAAILSSTRKVKHWQFIITEKLKKLQSNEPISPAMNGLMDKSAALYMYAAGIFLVVAMLLLVALLSTQAGKEQAQKEIASFKTLEGNYATLYAASLPNPITVKPIFCGSTFCAFWLGDGALLLKHEQIDRLVTHNKSFSKNASAPTPPAR